MRGLPLAFLCLAACLEAPEPSGPADAATPVVDAAPASACDDAFGDLTGYQLCKHEGDLCTFYVQSSGATCQEVCAPLDSTCVESFQANDSCVQLGGGQGCVVAHANQICECLLPSPPTCDEIFGTLGSYILCASTETTCEFYVSQAGMCNDICAMVETSCVASYEANSGDCERQTADEECVAQHENQICVCERPPAATVR